MTMEKPQVTKLHFYFDYISPYAFFAWVKLKKFLVEYPLTLEIHPILFAGLLEHYGQLGPAEIQEKRIFTAKDTFRYAARKGIPFTGPKVHPFNAVTALRISQKEVCGEDQAKVVDLLFSAAWSQRKDLSDPSDIKVILEEAGFPAADWLDQCQKEEVKNSLKTQGKDAIAQGVFGVPSMGLGTEVFWGKDQFDNMADYLEGRDPKIISQLESFLRANPGQQRNGSTIPRA